ncbi:ABC transporter permease [Bacillus sp. T3]|uniref:ABC transporter permease n=1 Tax=Bacillus sp. T3 TaxID=467262 RepID=UPI00298156EC|nr:ABC transporter permease subunit [Bacillus sp. T3]
MYQKNKVTNFLNKYKGLLGILPAFLFVLFFFGGGFFRSLLISFGIESEFYGNGQFASAYKELIDPSFLSSFLVTVGIALIISLLSGIIGLVTALLLAASSSKRTWIHVILQLPFGVPHLLAGYMLMQAFMQTGWFSRIAYSMGWIDSFEQFPELVHDQFGIGVILAYMWKEIPFIVLLTYPYLLKLINEWRETANGLGASFSQMIRWVIVPLVMPLWVGGMWVVFAFAIGAYEIPALLARTSLRFVPVIAWQEYTQFGLERQPMAIAMNIVLAMISLLIGIILIYLQMNWYRKGRRGWRD